LARADETPFAAIYTTEVMPEGAAEVEQWLTWASGKTQESFNSIEGRTEFEYGFSNRFLGALYANYEWTRVVPHGPDAPDGLKDTTRFAGFSAEMIYQVLNPFTDAVGLALYAEPSIGANERALEFKLLLQKNFLDDRLVLAMNANLEYVWVKNAGIWEDETALEFFLGAAYRFAPGWYAGVEFLNENAYSGHIFAGAHAETNAFYLGPTLHYAAESWWATLGLEEQLPLAGNPGGDPAEITHGYLTGAERFRLRLRIGVAL
jgi:hypothetical protein